MSTMFKSKIFTPILISLPFIAGVTNANTITYPGACTEGNHLLISAVGDILLHKPLQQKAQKDGYISLWRKALPYLQQANMGYANLEGSIATGMDMRGKQQFHDQRWSKKTYTGHPMFNSHPSLAPALAKSGFDVVSLANNHSLDRYTNGLYSTQAILKKNGVAYTGAYGKNKQHPWYAIVEKNNMKIAWLGCTEHINGMDDPDHAIMRCYKKADRAKILTTIKDLKNKVDAIIVVPHWGEQYQQKPQSRQKKFARDVLNAGAIAVLGSHPHTLQPWEKYKTKDGRDTFIAYSLGNFVSNQGSLKNRVSAIVFLGLTKTTLGSVVINAVRYIPTYMQNRSGIKNIELTLLSPRSKNKAALKFATKILPSDNAIYPQDDKWPIDSAFFYCE